MERPEDQESQFFMDNLYTCEKFKFDISKYSYSYNPCFSLGKNHEAGSSLKRNES